MELGTIASAFAYRTPSTDAQPKRLDTPVEKIQARVARPQFQGMLEEAGRNTQATEFREFDLQALTGYGREEPSESSEPSDTDASSFTSTSDFMALQSLVS